MGERPDPLEESPIQLLRTARGEIGLGSSTVPYPSPEYAPETERTGEIQEDDRVRGVDSKVHCRLVVPVNDPPFGGDQVFLNSAPLFPGRVHPSGFQNSMSRWTTGSPSLLPSC